MNSSKYQQETNRTAIYPMEFAIEYLTLGLVGESGEIANKVKKILRDDAGKLTANRRSQLIDELGDVLWYVAQLCTRLGVTMEEVMDANIEKLIARKEAGTLGGSGDQR